MLNKIKLQSSNFKVQNFYKIQRSKVCFLIFDVSLVFNVCLPSVVLTEEWCLNFTVKAGV